MRKLFMILLERYSRTEKDRIFINRLLQVQISKEHIEENLYGNIYDHQVELLVSNELLRKAVSSNDKETIMIIKKGINSAFDTAVRYMQEGRYDDRK